MRNKTLEMVSLTVVLCACCVACSPDGATDSQSERRWSPTDYAMAEELGVPVSAFQTPASILVAPDTIQVEISDISVLPKSETGHAQFVCRVGVINRSSWPVHIDKTMFSASPMVSSMREADRFIIDSPRAVFVVVPAGDPRDDLIRLRPSEFWGKKISVPFNGDVVLDLLLTYDTRDDTFKVSALQTGNIDFWVGQTSKKWTYEIVNGQPMLVEQPADTGTE